MEKRKRPAVLQKAAALVLCALLAFLLWPQAAYAAVMPAAYRTADAASSQADGSDSLPPEEEYSILAPEDSLGLYQPETEPLAAAVCMVNEETGQVVYAKNAEEPLAAASLVKMMTCILTAEYMERHHLDLDTTMVDSSDKGWVYDALAEYREATGGEPSTADIRRGEVLSVRELLYAALLPSANEAALLLADFVSSGYTANFLYMMNTRAAALGCTGTRFVDANGLSEENVVTAYDMTLIVREFMKHDVLAEIASAGSYQMAAHERHNNPYYIHNTNRHMVQSSPYYSQYRSAAGTILGGKTGSLGQWQNFASKATKNGESYILAVLNSPHEADTIAPNLDPPSTSYRPALCESAALYAWAFDNLTVTSALDTTQPVTELKVEYSTEQDTVRLMPGGDVRAVLPKGVEGLLSRRYELPPAVAAPVEANTVVGSVTILLSGREIGTTDLMLEKGVERNQTLFTLSKVGDFFSSTYFKVLLGLILFCAVLYVGALLLMQRSRQRKRQAQQAAGPSPSAARQIYSKAQKRAPGQAAQNTQKKKQSAQAVGRSARQVAPKQNGIRRK